MIMAMKSAAPRIPYPSICWCPYCCYSECWGLQSETIHWTNGKYEMRKKSTVCIFAKKKYCNCIVTRGGVYDEISPEPKGNPEGGARGISRGLRRYFIVYPDSSHNTVILNNLLVEPEGIPKPDLDPVLPGTAISVL